MITTNKPLTKSKIDRLIADMIIIDLQPYSIVEDKGFLALMNALVILSVKQTQEF